MQSYRQVDERTRSLGSREATDLFEYPMVGWLFTHSKRAPKRSAGADRFSFPSHRGRSNPRKYPHAMEGK